MHLQKPPAAVGNEPAMAKADSSSTYYDTLLMSLYGHTDFRQDHLHTVGVTSCVHGEGVSMVATNLAIRAARSFANPVLLVEAGTGRSWLEPRAAQSLPGLAEILSGQAASSDSIQPSQVENMFVLGAGSYDNGGVVVHSDSVGAAFKEIADQFELIVVDLPPINETGPCLAIAGGLDGVLLTIEAERAPSNVTLRAKQQLLQAGANLLGVVLNKRREHLPRWLCPQK